MAQEAQNGGAAVPAAAEGVKAVTFSAVKPQLYVEAPKADDAVKFFKSAFGAEEVSRVVHPKRKADQDVPLLLSAELKLGSFSILVSDLTDEAPDIVKAAGAGSLICLETEDVEAALEKAIAAGAVAEGETEEGEGTCCGGRVGKLKDPYGNVWLVCSPAKKSADVEA